MSWLDLSAKIDAVKRELDGIDEAISQAMHDRSTLKVWVGFAVACMHASYCWRISMMCWP